MTSFPCALRSRPTHFSSACRSLFSAPFSRTYPGAPFLRHRRGDAVLVDIEPKIEFFFHSVVFAGSLLLKLQRSGTLGSRPLVRLCSPSKRRSSPRVNMNGNHTLLFNPVLARFTPRPQP